jgi:hypothetical protein
MGDPSEENDPPPESSQNCAFPTSNVNSIFHKTERKSCEFRAGVDLKRRRADNPQRTQTMKENFNQETPVTGRAWLVSAEVKGRSAGFYHVSVDQGSIKCLVCGHTSYDPTHVRAKFCPRCLTFHEDRGLMLRLAEGYHRTFEATDKTGGLRTAA